MQILRKTDLRSSFTGSYKKVHNVAMVVFFRTEWKKRGVTLFRSLRHYLFHVLIEPRMHLRIFSAVLFIIM